MTNTLAKRNTTESPRVTEMFDPFRSLFGTSPFGQLFREYTWPQYNLMHRTKTDDGSTVLEYNLAGFKPEQIAVKYDTVAGELMVHAENEERTRESSFVVGLPQYASPEDVKTSYDNGVLSITIAPLEKRKESAIVDIPLSITEEKPE